MMKIILNPDNLRKEECQIYHKVIVVVEQNNGNILIGKEGNKYVLPGGKIEKGESPRQAIKRELKEETGIEIEENCFVEKCELESYLKDFYDYREKKEKKRYMSTILYYVKTTDSINLQNQNLTIGEIEQGYKILSLSKEQLKKVILEDHSMAKNGKYFDIENKLILEKIINEEG